MNLRLGARRGGALVVATALLVLTPILSAAAGRTEYVSWTSGVIPVLASVGTETTISFAPDEQITYASVDDAVRWDAKEASPISLPDGTLLERVAVTPSETSATMMLIRTTQRVYHIRLIGVVSAPSQVAFVYSRTFISRAPAPLAVPYVATPTPVPTPTPTTPAATPSPRRHHAREAALVPPPTATPVPTPTPTPVPVTTPVPVKATPSGSVAQLPPADGTVFTGPYARETASPPPAAIPYASPPPDRCRKPQPTQRQSEAVGALTFVAQGFNAGVTSSAVSHGASHAILGPHGFAFYLGFSLLEDLVVARLTKHWCPADQNNAALFLTGANIFNAVHTGVSR